jgi:tetratricopeptide (TPR) repeat protein
MDTVPRPCPCVEPRVPERRRAPSRSPLAVLLCAALLPRAAADTPDPAVPLEQAIVQAEESLRQGERQIAESRYRAALQQGWMLRGSLDAAEGRWAEAKSAFTKASIAAVDARAPLTSLGLVHLRLGETTEAVGVLGRVVTRFRGGFQERRLLAQALVAAGRAPEALQELEEARAAAPQDPEVAFSLASGYLHAKRIDAAERLFAEIVRLRPIPQTHVLIGRTYRDFGEYERARASLRKAIQLDPAVRRAHYYLGTVELFQDGALKLEDAVAHFRQELKLAPKDPLANLYLGAARVEARQHEEALPFLELAVQGHPPSPEAFHYFGRCLLGLDRPQPAVAALERALELAKAGGARESQLGSIHYQLGLALRRAGRAEDAAAHFATAEQVLAGLAQNSREKLARYLADLPDPQSGRGAAAEGLDLSALEALAPEARRDLHRRASTALARAYFNLGVMQAQAEKPARAAEFLEQAAEADPEFPQVHYSLGLAQFNAGRFPQATAPLERAYERSPADDQVRRLLALAWLNAGGYDKAAELLARDPERERNPSLQYAYGMALVRSGRALEARPIFSRMLAVHGDSAELNVLLGQAHAQQGDFDAAVQVLRHALELKADVPEAQGALGVIYLKQGKLAEAEAALRAELSVRPADEVSQYNLATVLELVEKPQEAEALLRALLKARPDQADGRYLLGKILLARGAADEAVLHLEAAVRLAPDDPKSHYQLGQAYQKQGRAAQAQEQFELFQKLKDKRREGTP